MKQVNQIEIYNAIISPIINGVKTVVRGQLVANMFHSPTEYFRTKGVVENSVKRLCREEYNGENK